MRLAAAIVAVTLAGCGWWDMTAEAWKHAEELCRNNGGARAADFVYASGRRLLVTAACADNVVAKAYYERERP